MIIQRLRETGLCRVTSLNLPFIMSKFLFQVFIMGKLRTKDFPPDRNLMLRGRRGGWGVGWKGGGAC